MNYQKNIHGMQKTSSQIINEYKKEPNFALDHNRWQKIKWLELPNMAQQSQIQEPHQPNYLQKSREPNNQQHLKKQQKAKQIDRSIIHKNWLPFLSGKEKEVMVQPRLVILTCMVPLLSSKICGFWSAITHSLNTKLRLWETVFLSLLLLWLALLCFRVLGSFFLFDCPFIVVHKYSWCA